MADSTRIVELFAGPGGWSEGLRSIGLHDHATGVEFDEAACVTARAAGHRRVHEDVRDVMHDFRDVRGIIASPPCQTFSIAGKGSGRADLDLVLEGVRSVVDGDPLEPFGDERTALVLEPLRWIKWHQPEWVAMEQVATVQPVWDAYADVLREWGYAVATGKLSAEQYGVPQTRQRAVLVASRTRTAALPTPTHSRYYSHDPRRLDMGVLPWVTMAEAVGWGYLDRPSTTVIAASSQGGRRSLDGGSGCWRSALSAIEAGRWVRRPDRLHLPLNRGELSTASVRDVAILQTFPADYPWSGTETKRCQQVGNAIPPRLAASVLAALVGERAVGVAA